MTPTTVNLFWMESMASATRSSSESVMVSRSLTLMFFWRLRVMWLESCWRQIPPPYWVVFPESMSLYTWVRFVHLKQLWVWNLNMDQTRSTVY